MPATFQRYINEQLREHLDVDATVYMDDMLAHTSDNEEDNWKTVRNIFNKLAKAALFLDIDKCEFLCKEVKCLGFIIRTGDSVTVDPVKVKAILDWEAPSSVKGVRSFLGFANFYRCFINKILENSSPSIALTKKESIWRWGTDENSVFEQLKTIFVTKPVLAKWDPDRKTVMEVDFSGYALGGCLSQKNSNGTLPPVA